MSKETNDTVDEKKTQLYELAFHIIPETSEEEVAKQFESIKESVTKAGGVIASESTPQIMNLAYEMVKSVESKNYKYKTAYFGWVKFESAPETLEIIKETMDLNPEVLRHIIVKTPADADASPIIATDIVKGKDDSDEDDEDDESEDVSGDEIDEEDIVKESKKEKTADVDKAIDELVS